MIAKHSVNGEWKPDCAVLACEKCSIKFTFTRRRHHCRYCGGIFCSSCSNIFIRIPNLLNSKPQRVCKICYISLLKSSSIESSRKKKKYTSDNEAHENSKTDILGLNSDRLNHTKTLDKTSVIQTVEEDKDVMDERIGKSDDYDSTTDSDDVSAAIAGVYSSVDDGQHTSSINFIASLQENLKNSEDLDVINVLMYVSDSRYQVILVTVSDGETMSMLARRLVDAYFRLQNGPFKNLSDVNRENLLKKMNFFTESAMIEDDASAIEVTSQFKNLVLSTLPLNEMQRVSQENYIRDFFSSEVIFQDEEECVER